jgi:S1-C subfamily serine protease
MRALAGIAVAAAALAGCGTEPPPAVVQVHGPDSEATAFAVGGGRVVTVAHVLRGDRPVLVGERRARVLRVDRALDVAVLDGGDGAAVPRTGSARAGERVSVRVLRPGGARSLPATVRRVISARIGGARRPALELDAAVMPGDSGAPVVDGDGRLVGVVFAEASDRDAIAYALDVGSTHVSLIPPS